MKGGNTLLNKVKEMRKEKGFTQKQVAQMVSVSQRTIISLEKSQYKPSIMLAYRLAYLFGTSIEELFCLAEIKRMEDQALENL